MSEEPSLLHTKLSVPCFSLFLIHHFPEPHCQDLVNFFYLNQDTHLIMTSFNEQDHTISAATVAPSTESEQASGNKPEYEAPTRRENTPSAQSQQPSAASVSSPPSLPCDQDQLPPASSPTMPYEGRKLNDLPFLGPFENHTLKEWHQEAMLHTTNAEQRKVITETLSNLPDWNPNWPTGAKRCTSLPT